MNSSPLPGPVNPGQPTTGPSASAQNAGVEAARYVRGQQNSRSGAPWLGLNRTGDIIYVINGSNASVERGGVLGLDSAALTPTNNAAGFWDHVVMNGVTPAVATHTGNFVITIDPIPAGKLGRAWISGIAQVRLDVTAATDTFADVEASTGYLKTGTRGSAQIVWKDSGTGKGSDGKGILGIVRLGNPQAFAQVVTLSSNGGSAGDAGTMTSWTYDAFDLITGAKLNGDSPLPLTGNGQRVLNYSMTAGSWGIGQWHGTTFVLVYANEHFTSQSNCSDNDYTEDGFT